jgi:hypothetical protein
MSYKLADGSKSTDYKIGDAFQQKHSDRVFVLKDNDESSCPWFVVRGTTNEVSRYWGDFIPVKAKKNASLIHQLHKTIMRLQTTIAELES